MRGPYTCPLGGIEQIRPNCHIEQSPCRKFVDAASMPEQMERYFILCIFSVPALRAGVHKYHL